MNRDEERDDRALVDGLPQTVRILDDRNSRGRIYLVGTAHFSRQSQDDVVQLIRSTKPDVLMLELCQSRVNILSLDEETLLRESAQMNLAKLRAIIRTNGFVHGIIHVLLLNMSASLTRQLGMAPGGEFRAAFREAQRQSISQIVLGDRPVGITLKRAMNSLSTWKKIRLVFSLLSSQERITSDDVEKFKEKDLLEQVLEEMSDQYPELCRVFVKERDLYLAYSLNKCLQSIPVETTSTGFVRPTVVAVVGIGHLPGIVEQWNRSIPDNVDDLLRTGDDERRPTQSNRRSFCSTSLKILSLGSICLFIFYLNRCRFRSLKM